MVRYGILYAKVKIICRNSHLVNPITSRLRVPALQAFIRFSISNHLTIDKYVIMMNISHSIHLKKEFFKQLLFAKCSCTFVYKIQLTGKVCFDTIKVLNEGVVTV